MLLELLNVDITTILVFLVTLFLASFWFRRHDSRLPPCPTTPLPILGHILHLKKNPRTQFKEWGRKLDVFSLYLGNNLMIVVNGYDAIKDLLLTQGDSVSDRPPIFHYEVLGLSKAGILFSSGDNWKEQRATSVSILRNFGMGKDRLAEKIEEEMVPYIDCIKEKYAEFGKVNILLPTHNFTANIICSIIVGKRFDYNDDDFKHLIKCLITAAASGQGVALVHLFPALRYLPGDFFNAKTIQRTMGTMLDMFAKTYVKQKGYDEYDENNLDNFIAMYIFERNKKLKAGQSTYLNDRNLECGLMDLFGAGTETTSTTVNWCILYILHNPDVQEKIHQEILREIGLERRPNMGDKSNLVYLNAVIMETQRLASIVPLSVTHVVSSDVTYGGYTIPKGTQVVPNLDSVLHDEKIWGEDVDTFRPERFLDENGQLINRPELIPFSIGNRICLGEGLAKMELFLLLATMYQRFKFLPTDPGALPSLDGVFGLTVPPHPFEVKLEDRLDLHS